MKKFLFGLIAIAMFSFTGFAKNGTNPGEKVESAAITFITADSNSTYNFNSVREFTDHSEKIIESLSDLDLADECTVTISMSVTVTVNASIGVAGGSISTTVSGSITASCEGAVAAGKKLRAQLVAMAGG